MDERFIGLAEQTRKQDFAMEKRLDALNAFRQALEDQRMTHLPRAEYQVQHQNIVEKALALSARIDKLEAKGAGVNAAWGYLVAALSLAAMLWLAFKGH